MLLALIDMQLILKLLKILSKVQSVQEEDLISPLHYFFYQKLFAVLIYISKLASEGFILFLLLWN